MYDLIHQYHDPQFITDAVEQVLLINSTSPHPQCVHVHVHCRLQQVPHTGEQMRKSDSSPHRTEFENNRSTDSQSRRDLVLEGVSRDPIGAFEENWFVVDTEIKAETWRAGDRLLDQFHCTEINLQHRY